MHRTTDMSDIHSFYELELDVEKAVDKHFLYEEIEHYYIQYILLKLPGFLKHYGKQNTSHSFTCHWKSILEQAINFWDSQRSSRDRIGNAFSSSHKNAKLTTIPSAYPELWVKISGDKITTVLIWWWLPQKVWNWGRIKWGQLWKAALRSYRCFLKDDTNPSTSCRHKHQSKQHRPKS